MNTITDTIKERMTSALPIGRTMSVAALAVVLGLGTAYGAEIPSAMPAEAGGNPSGAQATVTADSDDTDSGYLVTPNDWTYTAIKTLIKHGAIKDSKGFTFDGMTTYTKDELMPLIDEIVEKREQMNTNDREFALRIYQENMRDVMNYRAEKDRKEKLEKRRQQEEKRAEKAAKDGKVEQPTEAQQEALDKATDDVNNPNGEKALTEEQIKKKMEKFKVDDSRVKVSGDVRIRYQNQQKGKSAADSRVRTEMRFTL